jgi:hypothetical protein
MSTHTDPPNEAYMHWESPYGEEPPPPPPPPLRGPPLDFRPLFMLFDAVRRSLPANLEEQFTALLREVLLTTRALIDWYLERLERKPAEPRVEDIPID